MEAVGHDFRGQRAVGRQQLVADILVGDLLVVRELRQLSDLLDHCANGIGGGRGAGEYPEQQRFCLRLPFLEFLDGQAATIDDFVVGVAVDVVGAPAARLTSLGSLPTRRSANATGPWVVSPAIAKFAAFSGVKLASHTLPPLASPAPSGQ